MNVKKCQHWLLVLFAVCSCGPTYSADPMDNAFFIPRADKSLLKEKVEKLERWHASTHDDASRAGLAAAYIRVGRLEEAIALLQQIGANSNSYVESLLLLGNSHYPVDVPKARDYWRAAITASPHAVEAWMNLSCYDYPIGASLPDIDTLLEAEKNNPDDRRILTLLGKTYSMQDRNNEAREIFERLLTLYPGDIEIDSLVSLYFLSLSENERAISLLDPHVREKGTGIFQLAMALRYDAEGATDKAIARCKLAARMLESSPIPDFVVESNLIAGLLLAQSGRHKEAVEYFRKTEDAAQMLVILYYNPKVPFALAASMAASLSAIKDYGKAADYFNRALRLANDEKTRRKLHGFLADARWRAGLRDEALGDIHQGLREYDDAGMRYDLAVMLHAMSRSEEAAAELERVIALAPSGENEAARAMATDLLSKIRAGNP